MTQIAFLDKRTGEIVDPQELNDEDLLKRFDDARQEAALVKGFAGRLEQEICRRMDERHATGIPSEVFECKGTIKNRYPAAKLVALKEKLNPTDLAKCWTDAHWSEPEWLEESWDMRATIPTAKTYGDAAVGIVEQARESTRTGLTFKRLREED